MGSSSTSRRSVVAPRRRWPQSPSISRRPTVISLFCASPEKGWSAHDRSHPFVRCELPWPYRQYELTCSGVHVCQHVSRSSVTCCLSRRYLGETSMPLGRSTSRRPLSSSTRARSLGPLGYPKGRTRIYRDNGEVHPGGQSATQSIGDLALTIDSNWSVRGIDVESKAVHGHRKEYGSGTSPGRWHVAIW